MILRFDSVGGASGDMILAALLDLGADAGALRAALRSLDLGPLEVKIEPARSHGMHGTRVDIVAPQEDHHHRTLKDIRELIRRGALFEPVKKTAVEVFERLAAAEAHVHNTNPETLHFHEVAGVDSIADIVGGCFAAHSLGVERAVVSPLPLGTGFTRFSHGVMPVPVPAVVELLKGFPIVQTDERGEMVTPTGAALLMQWSGGQAPSSLGICRIVRSGNGFGHRTHASRPNLLRATLLEPVAPAELDQDECLVLECNLDDMTPELLGSLTQKLMADGALDVFVTPVQMKKQRPGSVLTVLCRPPDRERFLDAVFTGTTTFGVREYSARRTLLARRFAAVNTPWGEVRVKIGTWKGRDITRAPEHDDCLRCAEKHGVPVRAVYEAALRADGPIAP